MILRLNWARHQGGRWQAGLHRRKPQRYFLWVRALRLPRRACTNLPVLASGCLPSWPVHILPLSLPLSACHLGCLPWASA